MDWYYSIYNGLRITYIRVDLVDGLESVDIIIIGGSIVSLG